MTRKENYKISLEEHKLIGKQIIARQHVISFAEALEQIRRLKKISSVNQQSKKSRVKVLSALLKTGVRLI
jgi:parvulin-like peptidyl-prolyl isomerase